MDGTKSDIDFVAISIGLITAIVLYFISFFSIVVLPAFLTGAVAGFLVNSNNSAKSLLYGIVTSLIGMSIGYAVINSFFIGPQFYLDIPLISNQPSIGELLIVSIGLGAIGGFLGYYMKRIVNP
jgi:hypothetical protein